MPDWISRLSMGWPLSNSHEQTDPTRTKDIMIYPDTDVVPFVEWQFNNGSDFTKITAEVLGPSTEQQIQMVNTAHHEYNKQAMTHAADIHPYSRAVQSYTDGIQHVPDDGLLDNATINRIIQQGQFVTPTFNVFEFAYKHPTLKKYFAVEPGSTQSLAHAETTAKMLRQAGVPPIAGTDPVRTLVMNGIVFELSYGLTLHYEM